MREAPLGRATTPDLDSMTVRDAVCCSFALGWQMSRLFVGPLEATSSPRVADDLPGLSGLSTPELFAVGIDQVDAGLHELNAWLAGSPIELPDTAVLRAGAPNEMRQEVLKLHVALLTKLTAADFRCGKAYGLGRALADTCGSSQSASQLIHHLDPTRGAKLSGWLDDLKSAFPDHAAQTVADSFGAWIEWADEHPLVSMQAAEIAETSRALHAQGQRWRALLSGEKRTLDSLDLADYLTVGRRCVAHSSRLAGQLALSFWEPAVVAGGLLVLGVVLVVSFGGGAHVFAGLGVIAVAVALAWKTAASSLSLLAKRLEGPVWDAECDRAAAERISSTPDIHERSTENRSRPLPRTVQGRTRQNSAHQSASPRAQRPAVAAPEASQDETRTTIGAPVERQPAGRQPAGRQPAAAFSDEEASRKGREFTIREQQVRDHTEELRPRSNTSNAEIPPR